MARNVDEVVVATTSNPNDEVIEELCNENGIACFRGSEEDVLGRVAGAAREMDANVIVQAGADCPFYDPDIIVRLVDIFLRGGYHYVCNDYDEGFPIGVNVHVFSAETLYEVERLATAAADRENVVTYILDHPEKYRIYNLAVPSELARPDVRVTLDYPEDLEFMRMLVSRLDGENFRTLDIIRAVTDDPALLKINRHCKMKKDSVAYLRKKD